MTATSENNKRIVKNTIILYFRMFLIMAVTLYTSRIVLKMLGVDDYGIYTVIGGVVTIMGVLNGAMAAAVQRYLTFELGKGDSVRLTQTFSMCMTIFLIFAILLLVLAETIGLWFVNKQLVIPENRIVAANWVYQFSILAAIATLLYTPYNAIIIAHEKMSVFAYVSILEGILRLIVAGSLIIFPYDRLIAYGGLLLLTAIVITGIYIVYCVKNYEECRYHFYWEKGLFNQLLSYSAWNMFASVAYVVKGQGLNILLNQFFSPVINASHGIASQVNSAATQFFTNFYTAVRPQITKYYAQGNLKEMFGLVFRSSKLSFYLVWIISLPILIETPYIIHLWLGQTPDYVIPFTRIIIVISTIEAMATPLMTTAQATGHIKLYQLLVGTLTLLIVPISYVFLRYLSFPPTIVLWVSLLISVINLFIRLWIVHRLVNFPVWLYIKKIFITASLIAILSLILPIYSIYNTESTFINFCLNCVICILSSLSFIYILGLTQYERKVIITTIKGKLTKRH